MRIAIVEEGHCVIEVDRAVSVDGGYYRYFGNLEDVILGKNGRCTARQ